MVCDLEYSDCFGFMEEETKSLLEYYGLKLSEDVKAMYDGYKFGATDVYNPWSVTSYAARKRLEPYWVNTSFELQNDASLWGLLINAGMITSGEDQGDGFHKPRIPNYEVRKEFQNLTAFHLGLEEGHIAKMLRCLRLERMEEFVEEYQCILLELPSYHDLKSENSYHMMMLGMCAFLYMDYEVVSNRESGRGRSDIFLYTQKPERSSMIMEFKYMKDEGWDLAELAGEAIEQIKEKRYDVGMTGRVYYVGLAHYGELTDVR